MPPVLVVIFWLWFAVSVVLLIQRRISAARRRRHERTAQVHASTPAPTPERTGGEDPPAFPAVEAPSADGARPSLAEMLDAQQQPVASILSGISMPCELIPLTSGAAAEPADASRVVFYTTGHPASSVGADLADELERLGMTVTSTGDTTATATGDRGAVDLAIFANPQTVSVGDAQAFPTAPPDSVVVEIRSR